MRPEGRSALPASWQFSQLQRDLGRMTVTQRRKLRENVERVGQSALSDARSRAGSWSSRIPSAITMRGFTSPTTGRVGVELRVSKNVPHARPYEGISQQGSMHYFRRPVFPNPDLPRSEWRWRRQETRPYLWPAVQGRAPAMRRAVEQAVEDAARDAGFR